VLIFKNSLEETNRNVSQDQNLNTLAKWTLEGYPQLLVLEKECTRVFKALFLLLVMPLEIYFTDKIEDSPGIQRDTKGYKEVATNVFTSIHNKL